MAILTDSISFGYNRNVLALSNVSIHVPYGEIYSLLGPSGCGKTTLLNIILGYYRPNSGSVLVFGQQPGPSLNHQIGYMPQELGLSPLLPINETFHYFARVNHVKDEKYIKSQIEKYLKILGLDDANRRVSDLSMGQKRVLSLGVILISKPRLLLLDEPTVGIDSLIRQQIWDHLRHLCTNEGITVVLTTHYIDEARESSFVSFLRDGHLLAEESPKYLLKKLNCQTLEEAFSCLCMIEMKQWKNLNIDTDKSHFRLIQHQDYNKKNQENISKCSKQLINFDHLQALFYRDYFFFRNNLSVFLSYLIIPLLTLCLVGVVFNNGIRKIPVAIVNDDNYIDFTFNNDSNDLRSEQRISDIFIDDFNTTMVTLKLYDNEYDAERSIELGENQLLISFRSNFSQAFVDRFYRQNIYDENYIDLSNIHLYFDYTNFPNMLALNNSILLSLQSTIQKYFSMHGLNAQAFTMPIEKREVIYGSNQETMLHYLFPPSFFYTQFVVNMAKSSFEIIHLSDFGCLNRDLMQGVTALELIIQFLLSSTLAAFTQLSIMTIFVFGVLKFSTAGSYSSVFLVLLPITLQGMISGVLLAVIVTHKLAILFISVGLLLALGLTSGIFWPIETWPTLWQQISTKFHPWTLSLRSLQSIMIRGWNIDNNFDVFFGNLVGILHCVIFIILIIIIFQYKNKRFK